MLLQLLQVDKYVKLVRKVRCLIGKNVTTGKSLLGQIYEYGKRKDQLEKGNMDFVELRLNYCVEFIDEKLSHLDIENCQRKMKSFRH